MAIFCVLNVVDWLSIKQLLYLYLRIYEYILLKYFHKKKVKWFHIKCKKRRYENEDSEINDENISKLFWWLNYFFIIIAKIKNKCMYVK